MKYRGLENGQGVAEYALIFVLLVIVAMVALNFLGAGIRNALYNTVISNL